LIDIALLPGDGVGPEVTSAAIRVAEATCKRFGHELCVRSGLIGGCAIDATGTPLPDETIRLCTEVDAVLLGAVGGPRWDDPAGHVRPEQGLLGIRKSLGLYANLRPVRTFPSLASLSPVRQSVELPTDFVVVRELTGGIYFGEKRLDTVGGEEVAFDACVYNTSEVERIIRVAAQLARSRQSKLLSVDKANVLETSRLWRRVAERVMRTEFPDVSLEHMLVDACAMFLLQQPSRFDVIVTENMFGDILTDEASVLAGSMGLLPSASLGTTHNRHGFPRGLYEPIHGSAPDIAGRGIANPVGTILAVAMMFRHSFGLEDEAHRVELAVAEVLADGVLTADLGIGGNHVGTEDLGEAIAAHVRA
jgi:3-isopropylmalate dehydrogenase